MCRIKFLICFIAVILLDSCSSSMNNLEETFKTYQVPFSKSAKGIVEFMDDIEITFLEETDSSLIRGVSDIIFRDDRLLVVEAFETKLFEFNLSGTFIRGLDKEGLGPGEYTLISQIIPLNEKYLLFDNGRKVVSEWTFDWTFLKSQKFNFHANNVAPFDNGFLVNNGYDFAFDTVSSSSLKFDSNFNFEIAQLPFSEPLYTSLGESRGFQKVDEAIHIRPLYSDTTYVIMANMAKPIYRLDFGTKWRYNDLSDAYIMELSQRAKNEDGVWFLNTWENDEFVYGYFKTRSSFGDQRGLAIADRSSPSNSSDLRL